MVFDDPFVPGPAIWFGELIRARRQELGYSQRTLADRVCAASGRTTLTRHEIARYERETRLPLAFSLPSLATALRLPTALLRQTVGFSAWRRCLVADGSDPLPDVHPGYLIGVDAAQPMLVIGAVDTATG